MFRDEPHVCVAGHTRALWATAAVPASTHDNFFGERTAAVVGWFHCFWKRCTENFSYVRVCVSTER